MTSTTATVMADLYAALDAPREPASALGSWRWTVRRRLVPLRDELEREPAIAADGWLSARRGRSARERAALLERLLALGPQVLESPRVDDVRDQLKKLLADVERHLQRVHDLAYDEVELEIGGSE
jgi:hypothetical protein